MKTLLTAAEAQAFKRAAACFGLGRYLYCFKGVWVDLDERKRPKSTPQLFDWGDTGGLATGSKTWAEANAKPANPSSCAEQGNSAQAGWDESGKDTSALVCQIEAMAEPLGRRLYRGILKTVARAWNPSEIREGRSPQQSLGANAIRRTGLAAPGSGVGQGWSRDFGAHSPVFPFGFNRSTGQLDCRKQSGTPSANESRRAAAEARYAAN